VISVFWIFKQRRYVNINKGKGNDQQNDPDRTIQLPEYTSWIYVTLDDVRDLKVMDGIGLK